MTTKAPKDYSQGKIYKIEPTCDHEVRDIYIGSTTKQYLSQQMTNHRKQYLQWEKEISIQRQVFVCLKNTE